MKSRITNAARSRSFGRIKEKPAAEGGRVFYEPFLCLVGAVFILFYIIGSLKRAAPEEPAGSAADAVAVFGEIAGGAPAEENGKSGILERFGLCLDEVFGAEEEK